jgi:glycosyltransferase involved in cell wall biosynthesis
VRCKDAGSGPARPGGTRLIVSRALTRLALVTEIPAPYRIPLFNALAERVELRVLFLAERDPRREFFEAHREERRFDHRVLPGPQLRRGGRWIVFNRGVLRALRRFRPDAVAVGGWNQPAFWLALAYCRIRRIPLLIWIESTARDARSEAGLLALARRAMVHGAAGAYVPGRASAEYARSLGVGLVESAPNAIEARVFERAAVDRSGRDNCTFLYVGRLDPEKGLDTLLTAFRDVPGELVIVGEGMEAESLRAIADERVRFVGAKGRDDVVAYYRDADVFVLPSRSEPWGMVLNEAAAAGLPLVATEESGATHDLIDGNGFMVPAGNVSALREALARLAGDRALRERLGQRSRELARRFTPEAWADGVVRLASSTVKRSPTR